MRLREMYGGYTIGRGEDPKFVGQSSQQLHRLFSFVAISLLVV